MGPGGGGEGGAGPGGGRAGWYGPVGRNVCTTVPYKRLYNRLYNLERESLPSFLEGSALGRSGTAQADAKQFTSSFRSDDTNSLRMSSNI